MKEKNDTQKEIKEKKAINYAKIIGIILGAIAIIGISYALFNITISSDKKNTVKVGALSLVLDDAADKVINIDNAVPTSIDNADVYSFTIKNNGDYDLMYNVELNDIAFSSEDQCSIISLDSSGSKSTVAGSTSCDDFRMNDGVIAAKLEKTTQNGNDYSTVTTNNIEYVGQKSTTSDALDQFSNYTLLDSFQWSITDKLSKRVLDQSTISKRDSNNNPTVIKYNLYLWIPYPAEYSNDNNLNTVTTTTINADGSKTYTLNQFKASLSITAKQIQGE